MKWFKLRRFYGLESTIDHIGQASSKNHILNLYT
jgi:hypothetical protein